MNPFLQNLRLPVLESTLKQIISTKQEDGTVILYETPTSTCQQEQQQASKVFHIAEFRDKLFTQLKPSGRDLVIYILYNLKKDQDTIELEAKKVCGVMSCSRTTFYAAINQLTAVGLIVKRSTGSHWINPLYIFNGDRIKFVEQQSPACLEIVARLTRTDTNSSPAKSKPAQA